MCVKKMERQILRKFGGITRPKYILYFIVKWQRINLKFFWIIIYFYLYMFDIAVICNRVYDIDITIIKITKSQ